MQPALSVPNVFTSRDPHHVVITYDGSDLRLFVDGVRHSQALELSPGAALFSHLFRLNLYALGGYKTLYYGLVGIVSKLLHKPVDRLTLFQDSSALPSCRKRRDDKYLELFNVLEQNVKSVNLRLGSVRRSRLVFVPLGLLLTLMLGAVEQRFWQRLLVAGGIVLSAFILESTLMRVSGKSLSLANLLLGTTISAIPILLCRSYRYCCVAKWIVPMSKQSDLAVSAQE